MTKSKKGNKKKAQNPFDKKEWYRIQSPSMFAARTAGKTLITRTAGTKIASEGLKGRVFEINLADLNKDEDQLSRKVKLCCEDVQGYNVITNFHGMDLTRDKLCSLIKKWVTLIEANVDIKTTDGARTRHARLNTAHARAARVRMEMASGCDGCGDAAARAARLHTHTHTYAGAIAPTTCPPPKCAFTGCRGGLVPPMGKSPDTLRELSPRCGARLPTAGVFPAR